MRARRLGERAGRALAVVTAVASVGLAGCGPGGGAANEASAGSPQAPALAIVVGAHANAPRPQLDTSLRSTLEGTVRAEGYVSLVTAGGEPVQGERGPLTLGAANGPALEAAVGRRVGAVAGAIDAARAVSPEHDLLAAIDLAASSLRDRTGPRTLAILDNGLSTVGALRLQEPGTLDAEPGEVAALLAPQGELPDLRGTSVVFTGLGRTWDPQEPLRLGQRSALAELWTAVARAAGATEVTVTSEPQTAPPAAGLPPVTTVPATAPPGVGCAGTLRESQVAFVPDTASLADPAAAEEALAPLATCLRTLARPVTLTGTTSSAGDAASSRDLSARRAETIRDELLRRGVPADAVTTRGLGYAVPPCVTDRDAAGLLLPGPAALNRQVIVTPA